MLDILIKLKLIPELGCSQATATFRSLNVLSLKVIPM